jgi:hypothetical protein
LVATGAVTPVFKFIARHCVEIFDDDRGLALVVAYPVREKLVKIAAALGVKKNDVHRIIHRIKGHPVLVIAGRSAIEAMLIAYSLRPRGPERNPRRGCAVHRGGRLRLR